jgi:hypothetical protein
MRRLFFLLLSTAITTAAFPALAEPPPAPASPPPPAAAGPLPGAPVATPGPAYYQSMPSFRRGTERRSTGMMATGISLVGVGVLLMVAGTIVYVAGSRCDQFGAPEPAFQEDASIAVRECDNRGARVSGMAILSGGALVAGLGVPLWVLGAGDAPQPLEDDRGGKGKAARARPPELLVGPTSVGVRWVF